MPVFGRIERIFIVNSNDVFLYVKLLSTIQYSNHRRVYLLNAASDNYSCIKINRLYNVFPLYLRRIDVNGHFLSCVVLKHHIVNLL